MSLDAQTLLGWLPSILRQRDAALAQLTPGWLPPETRARYQALATRQQAGVVLSALEQQQLTQLSAAAQAGPLASLLAVFAEQFAALEEDLDQLYDDQFIETCADWVVPYIGDLIGYRPLQGATPALASPRAEVAHTIGYRRRKGTVTVLEQLARDVTGWDATAVEYFQRLVVTQHVNHPRLHSHAAPDLRSWRAAAQMNTAFDRINRSIDVRRIASQRGRHNIPNVGLVLWRLKACPLSASPAAADDARRYRFHPLGIDQPLYTQPRTREAFAALSTELDVPLPISRRAAAQSLADYYAEDGSASLRLLLWDTATHSATVVPLLNMGAANIRICALPDDAPGWNSTPATDAWVIDPELGRVTAPADLPAGTELRVDFHYGFAADIGGGEYDRSATLEAPETGTGYLQVPRDHAHLQDAITALNASGGIIEITDSGRYSEALTIQLAAGKQLTLRAADQHRPTLLLQAPMQLDGAADSRILLDGLLIAGDRLEVPAGSALSKLAIQHCTLVPGITLASDCTPQQPTAPSLVVDGADVSLSIASSICGALRCVNTAQVQISDSIVDATEPEHVAYAALDGIAEGGALQLERCTVVGKLHAQSLPRVSNSLLLARLASGDTWDTPVLAARRQQGCVRFSHLPPESRVPRRYRCLPESAAEPTSAIPRLRTQRYGHPAYLQITEQSGAQLLAGADNENPPGAYNLLRQTQRESNLRIRLAEYLRTGLEAGIYYDS